MSLRVLIKNTDSSTATVWGGAKRGYAIHIFRPIIFPSPHQWATAFTHVSLTRRSFHRFGRPCAGHLPWHLSRVIGGRAGRRVSFLVGTFKTHLSPSA